MTEIHPMTVEDFLLLMELNADIYPEFAALPDEKKIYLANINIDYGTARALYEDGRLFGVGGIRFIGVGEGWLITSPHIRNNRSKSLLRETKRIFEQDREEQGLWRIFATSKISENFLLHLGFKDQEKVLIWTRI